MKSKKLRRRCGVFRSRVEKVQCEICPAKNKTVRTVMLLGKRTNLCEECRSIAKTLVVNSQTGEISKKLELPIRAMTASS
jgi:hypothetical protein